MHATERFVRTTRITCLLLTVALAAWGCGEEETPIGGTGATTGEIPNRPEAVPQIPKPPADGASGASAAADLGQAASDPKAFVAEAASAGLFEVESSKHVLAAGIPADDKAFAERMVADHTKANDELKSIAQQKGIEVPAAMQEQEQAVMDMLKGAEGDALADQYHDAQLNAHRQAVALFEAAAQQLTDPELKAYARRTLPVLKGHLGMLTAHQHDH